jgi:hypothetical protein
MSVRFDKSIETTLKLLTKQIHIVWNQDMNRVIILLNLNVAEAFDTISHSRFIHNLRKRKISQWIINWVNNFMQNKSITLTINRKVIESFAMLIDISQSFSISSLLYFFYNAVLFEMCDRFDTNTRFLEYADNANILTYDKSKKKNCKILKKVHRLCEKLAHWHEFVFVSIKYEFIHFTRNHKKFNMIAIISIKNDVMKSKTNIRVLNLQIDIKFKWDSHVSKIQKKIIKQSMIWSKFLHQFEMLSFAKHDWCTFS